MKTILTFHHLGPGAGPLAFDPKNFLLLLDAIDRRGIEVVHLADLLEAPEDGRARVALTFDDGLLSLHEVGLPILRERGLPACVFVITDRCGSDNHWEGQPGWVPRLRLMDWSQLEALHAAGITIESHTKSHPDLRRCDSTRLSDELDGAGEEIERRLGRRPTCFAYPYGYLDEHVEEAVAARQLIAVTTKMGDAAGQRSTALPRVDTCYLDHPRLAAGFGSGSVHAYLGLRRFGRAVRDLLPAPEAG